MTTSVSTSGTISSAGIASGLNVSSIVSQLIATERAPVDKQIGVSSAAVNSKIAAFNSIQQALTNLQNASKALQGTGGAFDSFTSTSSDTNVFTATTSDSATAGSYEIQVNALATAQKLASQGFASTVTPIGTGMLTISVGGKSFHLNVDGTNNTPSALVSAINGSADNTGVTATLITADDGVHIVFRANDTGTDHALTITASGGDGGLNSLAYDPANGNTQLTQLTKAGDASISIDGYPHTSGSNQVSDAIPGVVLNLASAEPGKTLTLGVAADTNGIDSAVQNLVNAYNAVVSVIGNVTAYNASSKSASALTGDALANRALAQVRNVLMHTTTGQNGSVRSLFDLGVSTNQDGTLSLDTAKLNAASAGNAAAAANLFSSTGALGAALNDLFKNYLGDGGLLANQTKSLKSQLTDLSKQEDALNTRMDNLQALYTKQYNALDALMAQMSSTGAFINNMFGSNSSKNGNNS